jgi:hypothetical protein
MPALDKIGARVTDTLQEENKKSFLNFGEWLDTETTDFLYPIEKLSTVAADYARQYENIDNLVLQNIQAKKNGYWGFRNGQFKKLQDFNMRTLFHTIGQNGFTDFGNFLVARRVYFGYQELAKMKTQMTQLSDEMSDLRSQLEGEKTDPDYYQKNETVILEMANLRGQLETLREQVKTSESVLKNDGITEKEANDAYLENKDRWNTPVGDNKLSVEDMFDTLTKEDLNFLNDKEVQLLAPDEYNRLVSQEGYASFKRDFYDELATPSELKGEIRVGKTKVSALLRRTGSQRAIINPLASLITNHIEATRKGIKQIVYNKLGDFGIQGLYPQLFQKLQLEAVPNPLTGIISFPQEKDPNIIMARQNYKRVPILTDPQIKSVVDELFTPANFGIMEQAILFFGRTFTKGTTGILSSFTLKNPIIDMISSTAQSQTGYIPVITQIKHIVKAMQADGDNPIKQYAMEYMILAGKKQTRAALYDLTPEESIRWALDQEKGLKKWLGYVEQGIDITTIPTRYSEILNRLPEYIKARENGDSVVRALEKAGQVSAPFHHKGRFGGKGKMLGTWISALPYARASTQVLRQAIKTLARDPKSRARFLFVWGTVVAAMIAGLVALENNGTDEQKQIYEGLYGNDLSRFVYYPKPDGKTLGKIPVDQTMGWLGALINMGFMEASGKTDYKASDYLDAGTSYLPNQINISDPIAAMMSWMPKPFDTLTQTILGKRTYPKVIPLESQSQQRLPPGMRSTTGTSIVSKKVGEALNISPIKLDFLITGLFGRAAGLVLGKPSSFDFTSAFHQNDQYFTSSRLVENYYNAKTKNDQDIAGLKKDRTQFTLPQRMKINRLQNNLAPIDKLLSDFRDIDVEKYPERAQKKREQILSKIKKLKL